MNFFNLFGARSQTRFDRATPPAERVADTSPDRAPFARSAAAALREKWRNISTSLGFNLAPPSGLAEGEPDPPPSPLARSQNGFDRVASAAFQHAPTADQLAQAERLRGLEAAIRASGITTPDQLHAMLAKSDAYRAQTTATREEAKGLVTALHAGDKNLRDAEHATLDALPAGPALERYCAQIAAEHDAKFGTAPDKPARRQTAPTRLPSFAADAAQQKGKTNG